MRYSHLDVLILVTKIAMERGYESGDSWLFPLVNRIAEDIDKTCPSLLEDPSDVDE